MLSPGHDSLRNYRESALKVRAAYLRELVDNGISRGPRLPARARVKFGLIGATLAAAIAVAVMLTLSGEAAASSSEEGEDAPPVESTASLQTAPMPASEVSSASPAEKALEGYEDR
jgi:hypothetical protein